jgi:hypothetical protein
MLYRRFVMANPVFSAQTSLETCESQSQQLQTSDSLSQARSYAYQITYMKSIQGAKPMKSLKSIRLLILEARLEKIRLLKQLLALTP